MYILYQFINMTYNLYLILFIVFLVLIFCILHQKSFNKCKEKMSPISYHGPYYGFNYPYYNYPLTPYYRHPWKQPLKYPWTYLWKDPYYSF